MRNVFRKGKRIKINSGCEKRECKICREIGVSKGYVEKATVVLIRLSSGYTALPSYMAR